MTLVRSQGPSAADARGRSHEPALTAYRLQPDGSYQQVAHRIGDEPYEATEPVLVMIIPSALVTS